MDYKSNLGTFALALSKYYSLARDYDKDEYDRHSFCTLIHIHDKKPHKFDMRGWSWETNLNKSCSFIRIKSCNWTLTSGVCNVDIYNNNLKDWIILEEDEAAQVLYGR